MKKSRALVSVFVLICSVFSYANEDVISPWQNFQKGSWVMYKDTSTISENISYSKITVTDRNEFSVTLTHYTINESGKVLSAQKEKEYFKESDEKPSIKIEKKGTEEVEIEGKKYTCTVYEILKGGGIITQYCSKDVPTGFVKTVFEAKPVETVPFCGNEVLTKTIMVLVKTDEELKINNKTYKCCLYKMEFYTKMRRSDKEEFKQEKKVERKIWMNPDVPGYIVKTETTSEAGTTTMELVKFGAKKK